MPERADLVLAGEFPPADRDAWLAAVAAALDSKGGLSPEAALARLRTTTYDGITIEPLYTAANSLATALPVPRDDGWDVRQGVDAAAGPERAVAELERGATSILLDVTGLATIDAGTLETVLDGVLFDVAAIAVQAGPRWPDAAAALLALYDRAGLDAATGAGTLGADPIGTVTTGGASGVLDEELDTVAAWARRLGTDRPGLRVVTVDGTRFHDAGASDGQELGCTIAAAVEYLRALEARGVDLADAARRLELRLAATGDQFATIAKFRAVRVLWARVAEIAGVAVPPVPVHAVTSTAMMTSYDRWVNALRSTVACFAAGVAGADAVTVLPHDHLLGGEATELGRRIARNTQSILLQESHLAEVADPAGGSWYVERFTGDLAGAAWAWFQEIETAGGLLAAAASGLVAERLAATRQARQHDIDTRRAPLTGLTEFPNIDEAPPGDDDHPFRWAAEFEALRRRADRAATTTGRRPAVFLATIGTPATFTPRLTFAKNFFEVGGLATVEGPVTEDAAAIAAAFRPSGATVACLCSSDAAYASHAATVAEALDAAGATAVFLAGRPQAGVDRAIHAGVDVRATLTDVLDLLQVP